jgi:hypothetical protein
VNVAGAGFSPLRLAEAGLAVGMKDRSEKWGSIFLAVIAAGWVSSLALGFEGALVFLTVVGFLSGFIGLFRPVIGLLGVGILCTLDPMTRILLMSGGLLRWNSFNYLLVVAAIVALPVLVRIADPSSKALLAFVTLMFLGLAYSPDPVLGINDLLNVVSAFGLLTYFVRACHDRTILLWTGLTNGLLSGIGGLLFLFLQSQGLLRYVNHNAFSYFPLGGLFSICLAYPFARYRRRGQIEFGLLALLNIASIYLCGSRGGLLAGIGCILYILFRTRGVSARWLFLIMGLLVGGITLTVFSSLNERAANRIDKLFDESRDLDSRTSGRYHLAEDGWEIFKQNPFGVGTGGYASALAYYLTGDYESDAQKISHSAWVKTLAENGFLGPVLLGCYVVSFTYVGWGSRNHWALGILVTVTLGTTFLTREFHGKGLWFLAAGATMLMNRGSWFVMDLGPIRHRIRQRHKGWQRPRLAWHINSTRQTRNRGLQRYPGTAPG